MHRPEGIVAFYTWFNAFCDEQLQIRDLVFDTNKVAFVVHTEFRCLQPFPVFKYKDFDGLEPGDVVDMTNLVLYDLETCRFKRIRIFDLAWENHEAMSRLCSPSPPPEPTSRRERRGRSAESTAATYASARVPRTSAPRSPRPPGR